MIYSFSDFVQQWIKKADNDVLSAQVLLEHSPMILDNACFHCQQAIEKYLKALLIHNQKDITKTHDIEFLIEQCAEIESDFRNFDLKNVSLFAVKFRYPDDSLMPDSNEAKEYLSLALEIKRLVLQKIN
jgi:HEPN domain-containing protein